MEYLSKHLSDHTHVLNSKWRWPLIKEDLKILRLGYLSNHLLDAQILNLSLTDQIMFDYLYAWPLWISARANGGPRSPSVYAWDVAVNSPSNISVYP
jgi:hypothetical protein